MSSSLKPEQVVEYLKSNPSFVNDHEDLLLDLGLTQTTEALGHTSKFHQRQLQVLKDRENQQQIKMDIIVDSARVNLELEESLNNLASTLIQQCRRGEGGESGLSKLLKSQFSIDAVAFVYENNHADHYTDLDYTSLSQRVAHLSSICDDRVSREVTRSLFPLAQSAIRSCAFLPLSESRLLKGVMVLGSEDVSKFNPGFGVIFLDRLSRLASACLLSSSSETSE